MPRTVPATPLPLPAVPSGVVVHAGTTARPACWESRRVTSGAKFIPKPGFATSPSTYYHI